MHNIWKLRYSLVTLYKTLQMEKQINQHHCILYESLVHFTKVKFLSITIHWKYFILFYAKRTILPEIICWRILWFDLSKLFSFVAHRTGFSSILLKNCTTTIKKHYGQLQYFIVKVGTITWRIQALREQAILCCDVQAIFVMNQISTIHIQHSDFIVVISFKLMSINERAEKLPSGHF